MNTHVRHTHCVANVPTRGRWNSVGRTILRSAHVASWPKSNWPKSKLAEVEIGRSRLDGVCSVSSFSLSSGASRDNPRTPNVHISGPRRFKHHQNSTDQQEREKRMKTVAGEGKKERNFGPPALRGPTLRGPTLRGPTLRGSIFNRFGPPPFGASTLRGLHPSGPPPFGASTLRGLHPSGPPPFGPSTLRGPPFGAPPFVPHPLWSQNSTSKNWPKSNWPKWKLAEVEIGRSRSRSVALPILPQQPGPR